MRLTRLCAVVFAVATAMLATSAAATQAKPTQVAPTGMCCGIGSHLEAALHGSAAYPNVRGHTDYDSGMMGGRHFGMDMSSLGSLSATTLSVYAGGHKLGSTHVSGGRCHFERRGPGMPTLSSGAVVSVRTSGGTLVASGTLHRHHP